MCCVRFVFVVFLFILKNRVRHFQIFKFFYHMSNNDAKYTFYCVIFNNNNNNNNTNNPINGTFLNNFFQAK